MCAVSVVNIAAIKAALCTADLSENVFLIMAATADDQSSEGTVVPEDQWWVEEQGWGGLGWGILATLH